MRSQHCGYWCPGAKAAGHQYPQCWLNINFIGPVSYKNIAHKVNSIRKLNHILKKKWPSHLRVNFCIGNLVYHSPITMWSSSVSVKQFMFLISNSGPAETWYTAVNIQQCFVHFPMFFVALFTYTCCNNIGKNYIFVTLLNVKMWICITHT